MNNDRKEFLESLAYNQNPWTELEIEDFKLKNRLKLKEIFNRYPELNISNFAIGYESILNPKPNDYSVCVCFSNAMWLLFPHNPTYTTESESFFIENNLKGEKIKQLNFELMAFKNMLEDFFIEEKIPLYHRHSFIIILPQEV